MGTVESAKGDNVHQSFLNWCSSGLVPPWVSIRNIVDPSESAPFFNVQRCRLMHFCRLLLKSSALCKLPDLFHDGEHIRIITCNSLVLVIHTNT